MGTYVRNLGASDESRSEGPDGPPDALHAFLVDTIHSARIPLAVSMVMGMCITLAAFAMTGDGVFVAHGCAHVVIGLARLRRLTVYDRFRRRGISAREVVACDEAFRLWSGLYALALGLTTYELTAQPRDPTAFALALAACAGFAISFAARSAGRPWTVLTQVLGLTIPMIVATLTLPIRHGPIFAALVVGLDVAALAMGRHAYARIVALFRADEANRVMADSDMLTGLMNRRAMTRASALAIAQATQRPQETLAVVFVDLDRFKQVNDTLGHGAGDAVLAEAAARLRSAAGQAAIARMGGDEFMLLARLHGGEPEAKALGRAILDRMAETYEIGGAAVVVGGSVGLAFYPRHGRDIDALMISADLALYEAKRAGRNRMRVFDDELERQLADQRLIESGLTHAFERDELEVWHQPIHELESGEVSGYEALVRWRHPTLGLVMPDRFIPLAEQNGAIVRLGEIVLGKACREASRWRTPLTISVNVSPQQFSRPALLVAAVRRALEETSLDPARLFLEITESFVMVDSPSTRATVEEIAEMGVRFSLDDFGRGYSSLAYIQKYPFTKIKIDREFVRNIPGDKVSSAIVASVCLLARRIGMSVVAEGVETEMQRRALGELGVDFAQGYLFGRPAPTPAALAAFARWRASG